jgi:hypothetical protein
MRTLTIIALALLLVCNVALADDLNPPPWRGQPGTTFQLWEFSNSTNPAAPTIDGNSYGDPIAAILGAFPKTRWMTTDRGQDGVWLTEEWIQLDIPNTDVTVPNSYKEIWLQMTFDVGTDSFPMVFTVPDADPYTLEPVLLAPDQVGTYTYGIWDIILEPNPRLETIYILPRECTLYMDEIVVDTRCVVIPEPATMLMMVLGGIAFLIRRK